MNVVFIYLKSYIYITQWSSLVGIIWCQRFVALGDKYKFIWKIFCFRDCVVVGIFKQKLYTQNKSQKMEMWAIFPLNQSCSLILAASGFSTDKDYSWESYLFAADSFLLDLPFTWGIFLTFLHVFQEALPMCLLLNKTLIHWEITQA